MSSWDPFESISRGLSGLREGFVQGRVLKIQEEEIARKTEEKKTAMEARKVVAARLKEGSEILRGPKEWRDGIIDAYGAGLVDLKDVMSTMPQEFAPRDPNEIYEAQASKMILGITSQLAKETDPMRRGALTTQLHGALAIKGITGVTNAAGQTVGFFNAMGSTGREMVLDTAVNKHMKPIFTDLWRDEGERQDVINGVGLVAKSMHEDIAYDLQAMEGNYEDLQLYRQVLSSLPGMDEDQREQMAKKGTFDIELRDPKTGEMVKYEGKNALSVKRWPSISRLNNFYALRQGVEDAQLDMGIMTEDDRNMLALYRSTQAQKAREMVDDPMALTEGMGLREIGGAVGGTFGAATGGPLGGAMGGTVGRGIGGAIEEGFGATRQPKGIAMMMKKYGSDIENAATQEGVRPELLARLIWKESAGDPNAVSEAGARGLTQILPATEESEGLSTATPRDQIFSGAKYLGKMLKLTKGDELRALAAYHGGPGALEGDKWKKMPKTRKYAFEVSGKQKSAAELLREEASEGERVPTLAQVLNPTRKVEFAGKVASVAARDAFKRRLNRMIEQGEITSRSARDILNTPINELGEKIPQELKKALKQLLGG